MSIPLEIREAPHLATGLRTAAAACTPAQGVLKTRLTAAASMLEWLAVFARETLERVKALEVEAAAAVAARTDLEEHFAAINAIPPEWLRPPAAPPDEASAPVLIVGVDISRLGDAARLLLMLEQVVDASDDLGPDGEQLTDVIQLARRCVQDVFAELNIASLKVQS